MIIPHNSRVITINSNNTCETAVQTKYQIFLCILIFTLKVCLIVWNYCSILESHLSLKRIIFLYYLYPSSEPYTCLCLATTVLTLFIKPVLNTYILFFIRGGPCALVLVLFVRRNSNERQYQIAKHVRVYLQLKEIYSDIIQVYGSLADRSQTKCHTCLGFVILFCGIYKQQQQKNNKPKPPQVSRLPHPNVKLICHILEKVSSLPLSHSWVCSLLVNSCLSHLPSLPFDLSYLSLLIPIKLPTPTLLSTLLYEEHQQVLNFSHHWINLKCWICKCA